MSKEEAFTFFIIGALVYVSLAVYLFRLVGRRLPQGPQRTILRATLLALFFSLTLLMSHGGVVPFFALPILVTCVFGVCGHGRRDVIDLLLIPMAVQWVTIVGISMVRYVLTKPKR